MPLSFPRQLTLVVLSGTRLSEIVVQTLGVIAAIIAVFLCFFLGWRWASRQWQLPCPSLLGWALETRLYDRLSGTSATLYRMKLKPGQRILEIGPGPGRLLIPAAKRIQPGGEAVGIDIQPGMVDRLSEQGIDTVTIAGDMTQMCCDTTARQAVHRGLTVEFLRDATGTLDLSNEAGEVTAEELHRSILCAQQMMLSEVLDVPTWIKRL